MRRLVLALVPALVITGLYAGIPAPAAAVTALTGKLVDGTDPSKRVENATVRMRTVTADGPGVVVATATTGSDGSFSLDAGPTPDDEYYLQVIVDKQRYQGGWVGGPPSDPNYVQVNLDYATTYSASADLGWVRILPAFIRGQLVNAETGRGIGGVKVTARSGNNAAQFEGKDITNDRGYFNVTGIECEDDCYLRVVGEPKGYENGYRDCGGGVVSTWGAACASPIGKIGKVRLDRL